MQTPRRGVALISVGAQLDFKDFLPDRFLAAFGFETVLKAAALGTGNVRFFLVVFLVGVV